jgi:hypothetical protein
VGYGEGALAVLDALTGDRLGDIPLRAHPESFQLQTGVEGPLSMFPTWGRSRSSTSSGQGGRRLKIDGFMANYPMALDEQGHRLFVGCRHPARY